MNVIEITTKIGCRNNCVYCPQNVLIEAYKKRSHTMEMSFEAYKACVDKLPRSVTIEFSGFSEAWLNPMCRDMVLYAHSKGHKINIFTTLIGMSVDDFEAIKHISFGKFWLHLPSSEKYERISVNSKYLELLKRVVAHMENNEDKINVSYHIRGPEPHPMIAEILGNKLQKRAVGSRAGNLGQNAARTIARRIGRIGCARNLRQNVLLPNGEAALCCMDYGLKHILGNLLECEYEDLFKSEEFKRTVRGLDDDLSDTICRYCDMLAYNRDWKAKILNPLRENFSRLFGNRE